ncbi:MAG: N-acetyltransferase [Hyphomonadaceae bacterium]
MTSADENAPGKAPEKTPKKVQCRIREMTPADAAAVGELTTRAFGQSDEAGIIRRLEQDGSVYLQIVAVEDERIIGHALFYHVGVLGKLGALGLGPISVEPDRQKQGVGAMLINFGVEVCREAGVPLIFVLGSPDYYPKFGFTEANAEPFEAPWRGPHFMALRLRHGPPMSGKLIFPPAFGT